MLVNTEERIRSIICKKLAVEPGRVRATSLLAEDLGADRLDFIELVMTMEEEFDMDIPDDRAKKMKTVGDVIFYFSNRCSMLH